MENTLETENVEQQSANTVKIKEFLYDCLGHWKWFVLSLVVCVGLAFLYLASVSPKYQRSAQLMIRIDEQGTSMSANSAMLKDLGINNGNGKAENEIAMFSSPDLMQEVVRKLNINMTYFTREGLRKVELYGPTLPVNVSMPDFPEQSYGSFTLELEPNGDFTISDMKIKQRELERQPIHGRLGVPARTPLGNIIVTPGEAFDSMDGPLTVRVKRSSVRQTANDISKSFTVTPDKKMNNVVELSYTCSSIDKAQDIVSSMIDVYNNRWLDDKREIAESSSEFIESRLKVLQDELGDVDNDISDYKSANLVPDINTAATLAMQQDTESAEMLKNLRNQEYMIKYIRNYLRNSGNHHNLLPSNTGLESQGVSRQLENYNERVMERNSLVAQSSASNPLVATMDADIEAMRQALIATMENELVNVQEKIKTQEAMSGKTKQQIASNPNQARHLLGVERQQKVKEQLYLYLLQKREENQLNQVSNASNTRIIRSTDGPDLPVAPRKVIILASAFLLGLLIPGAILYMQEINVTVVRGRKDIKDLNIPFAGELPFSGKKSKSFSTAGHHKEEGLVVVKENSRNAINEAFRVIRTNIEFMSGKNTGSRVIMFTSANPGSGKTFVCFNLGKSFGIKGKKVVAVDLDMRKAALSKYLDHKSYGIADYLAGRVNDMNSIIKAVPDAPNMSIIPVGTIPPNPTELLFSDRLETLLTELRKEFDLVLVDCPPVEVVADASIISKFVDSTIFVLRAGLFRLDMLPVVEGYYKNNSLPGMSIVLNGTIYGNGTYGGYYGRSYGYGYGYGAGYGYVDKDDE